MNNTLALAAIATVALFTAAELLAAVVPLVIVLTLVPPEERSAVAEVLAAADSSRRLRLWPALRTAVVAQRISRTRHHR